MKLSIENAPDELRGGLKEIMADFPDRFNNEGDTIKFMTDPSFSKGKLQVESKKGASVIACNGKNAAFRALGRLMGALLQGKGRTSFSETPAFDMVGIMLDCSRNAVMNVTAVKNYLRRCALMGINTVMLYTEDTYEVPGEPFFGYLRGPYTQAELKELDDYADMLGIEMFPCIQTLGHMEQFLQWDSSSKYRDTNAVICAGDEEVYSLIERCIVASSSCFRSRRIHIGMDEAHGLGSGEYRKKFGEKPPFEIMNSHLARVNEICKKQGLAPMIWSDMYFRLGSEKHEYYDEKWHISDDVIANIPKDVQLVYWDYYHVSEEHYRKFINFHRRLGSTPVMGGGIWTWGRLWCGLPYSIRATNACMGACRKEGVREVFMTMWGDDGAECNYLSALPGLQHFAELAYADEVAPDLRAANLLGSCDFEFDSWMRSSELDTNSMFKDYDGSPSSASKSLFWQDPLLPLVDANVADLPIRETYSELANNLFHASEYNDASESLQHPALIAQVISLKTDLRRKLVKAYKVGDKELVKQIAGTQLKELTATVKKLWREHRETWMKMNKPFGWEVLEARYGGLMARLDTLAYRLDEWYNDKVEKLEELDVEILNAWPHATTTLPGLGHAHLKTPSVIK